MGLPHRAVGMEGRRPASRLLPLPPIPELSSSLRCGTDTDRAVLLLGWQQTDSGAPARGQGSLPRAWHSRIAAPPSLATQVNSLSVLSPPLCGILRAGTCLSVVVPFWSRKGRLGSGARKGTEDMDEGHRENRRHHEEGGTEATKPER